MVGSSTAYSQASSIGSDSICFTIDESKTLLKFARRGEMCDTLITAYEKKIKSIENVLYLQNEELQLSGKLITSQMMQIKKQSRKIQGLKILSISLGSILALETFYILFG